MAAIGEEIPDTPEMTKAKMKKQRFFAGLWLLAAFVILTMLVIRRGHPKNWRVGERWVNLWGGDWAAIVEEMNRETAAQEIENRRFRYAQLIESGFKCEEGNGNHNLCFHKLCIEGPCEIENLLFKLKFGTDGGDSVTEKTVLDSAGSTDARVEAETEPETFTASEL